MGTAIEQSRTDLTEVSADLRWYANESESDSVRLQSHRSAVLWKSSERLKRLVYDPYPYNSRLVLTVGEQALDMAMFERSAYDFASKSSKTLPTTIGPRPCVVFDGYTNINGRCGIESYLETGILSLAVTSLANSLAHDGRLSIEPVTPALMAAAIDYIDFLSAE